MASQHGLQWLSEIEMNKFHTLLLALLLSISDYALAHPHSWINLKSEFTLDQQGRLTALTQHWEFDMYYSLMTIADMMNEHGDQQKGLGLLGKGMTNSLKKYNYFSELKVNNRLVKLSLPKDFKLVTKLSDGKEILKLSMHFELPHPLAIENKPISFRVFDPTYYIDMRHYKASQVIIHTQNATECSTTVELPETSDELVEYANSLDKSQQDTQGLGNSFAEQVMIHCV
jgi:ABC-type uncharacterized transport system substrate-binding protein